MKILVAAQAKHICDQIVDGLSSSEVDVKCVHEGARVRNELVEYKPDVLICDMQSGNMGGVAVCIDARMEAEEDRSPDVAIILLLDREADRLLGRQLRLSGTTHSLSAWRPEFARWLHRS